jgi:tRNA uridine 5-carboxymethylaminomethyl modification enzyme
LENRTVVVVGGGHAGVEAALAAVRVGASAVLVTAEPSAIAVMPCNPAIGGVAKGCLVREIDALGGIMGMAADHASLQFRMLNLSKGPAVWGPRVQADSEGYPRFVRKALTEAGVTIVEGMACSLTGEPGRFSAVNLEDGRSIPGDAFVLATGTYLGGVLFRGAERWPGGRAGGLSSRSLDRFLSGLFHVERFKTGTSPRVVTATVATDALEEQSAHTFPFRFSLESGSPVRNRMLCHLARTNERTGRAVLENIDRSPLYGRRIEGKGPRYCPSYETKVIKFPERHEHPVHLEPLSPASRLSYLNGLSTSMPQDVQYRMLRTIRGLENVEIALFGYAVEYSRLAWGEFDMTLRLSGTHNLFAAGQILGTSGYEEAAALGLLAGANAARTALDQECVVPDMEESYLGVMVSDLVRKGIDEPYRLFSSRAENRLHLRQDNAHVRLGKMARDLGILRGRRLSLVEDHLKQYREAHELISAAGLEYLCRRPEAAPLDVIEQDPRFAGVKPECVETAFNDIKYDGYISRHRRRRNAAREHWDLPVPSIFPDAGISIEARQAIAACRPGTIREAAALPGVRASDLEVLTLLALKFRCST